jgi:hypothetical protein
MGSRTAGTRRLVVAAALCLLAGVAVAVALGAGSARRPRRAPVSTARASRAAAARHARTTHGRTARVAVRRRAPSPGTLPQTHAFPSSGNRVFKALMVQLWSGVVHDSLSRALPAFFPRAAYVQLKAIPSAGSDWSGRLVGDYGLDIGAAHALLGAGAARARLLRVAVPSSYGHWVEPGVCFNQIGYYEMPNARVVYSEDGATRSFGIASMISWRGVWYVVHLGAVLRPGDEGVVDEAASGAGVSAYSGTC